MRAMRVCAMRVFLIDAAIALIGVESWQMDLA